MTKEIEQKDSKKLTVMYVLIVFSIATVAVLAVIYFVEPEEIPEGSFLNPSPDEDKTIAFTGELTYEPEPEPVIIEEPEIVYDGDDYIVGELLEKDLPELTEVQLTIEMPQSVLDMSIFLTSYPDITHEDLNILMAYAVGIERDLLEPKIDAEARIIMVKLLQ